MRRVALFAGCLVGLSHSRAFSGPTQSVSSSALAPAVTALELDYTYEYGNACGWIGEEALTCPGEYACVLYKASSEPGFAGCCLSDDVNKCDWATSCVGHAEVLSESLCDEGCLRDRNVHKCTHRDAPFCQSWTYPGYDIRDYGCGENDASTFTTVASHVATTLGEPGAVITLTAHPLVLSQHELFGWSPLNNLSKPHPSRLNFFPNGTGEGGILRLKRAALTGRADNSTGNFTGPSPGPAARPSGADIGAIVGGTVGGVVGGAFAALIVLLVLKHRKRAAARSDSAEMQKDADGATGSNDGEVVGQQVLTDKDAATDSIGPAVHELSGGASARPVGTPTSQHPVEAPDTSRPLDPPTPQILVEAPDSSREQSVHELNASSDEADQIHEIGQTTSTDK